MFNQKIKIMKDKQEEKVDQAKVPSEGMVDLMLNILENPRMSKEDKALARNEIKHRIDAASR